ncbi:hypothetical protein Tco_0078020 [Tanacetum coccineum]
MFDKTPRTSLVLKDRFSPAPSSSSYSTILPGNTFLHLPLIKMHLTPRHSTVISTLQISPSHNQNVTTGFTYQLNTNPFIPVDNDPFVNVFDPEPSSDASSSRDVILIESNQMSTHQQSSAPEQIEQVITTPLDNVIG